MFAAIENAPGPRPALLFMESCQYPRRGLSEMSCNLSSTASVWNLCMKTRTLLITLAAAVAVGGFALALAQPVVRSGPLGAGRLRGGLLLQRAAERLNLTEDQKAQIKTELQGEKDVLARLLAQMHDERKELR